MEFLLGLYHTKLPEIWSPKTRSQVAIEVIELASMVAIQGEKLGRFQSHEN